MKRTKLVSISLLWVLLWPTHGPLEARAQHRKEAQEVIWEDPGRIPARDLYYGCGSAAGAPAPPFEFIREDEKGRSLKFRVRDAHNVVWSVKLGPEAQPETVSTRLVWSVGYFTEEVYYFRQARIENLPRLARGQQYVSAPGVVSGARFEARHKDIKRAERWDWNKNPFVGTRELDGLKVLMVLLNNYDTENNNRILIMKNPQDRRREARYVVTDLGATLGRVGGFGTRRTENNVEDFRASRFVQSGKVQFDYDTRPGGLGWFTIFYPPYFIKELRRGKTFQSVPVEHARWIGSLLSHLTPKQLYDAFRAADYDAETAEKYVRALRGRIAELSGPGVLVYTPSAP